MTIFLIGTITCFTAPNFSTLLIGRLIQACGVGVSMPLLQNIMLSIFPPEKRGSAMDVRNRYWACSCFRPYIIWLHH